MAAAIPRLVADDESVAAVAPLRGFRTAIDMPEVLAIVAAASPPTVNEKSASTNNRARTQDGSDGI
jgi:hypothetical protein